MGDRDRYRAWHPVRVHEKNDTPLRSNLEIRKCDAIALQAVAKGIANEGQQKMAWAAIEHICGLHEQVWMPEEHGGERETNFAAGKQYIGHQLRKIASISISVLTGEDSEREHHDRRTGRPADNRNSERAKQ